MKTLLKRLLVSILLLEARAVVRKYKPHIIAVTGSVGKTSTKDAIFSVVAAGHHVRRSDKSFNSEVGLPLTILGCPNAWNNPFAWLQNILDGLLLIIFPARYPEWLVLEVGADRPGDISSLAYWLPVDIAVITRLPEVPVHVEYFKSVDAVVEEKASLINALKQGGTLVLYADQRAAFLRERAEKQGAKVITFGFDGGVDVRGSDFAPMFETEQGRQYPIGMSSMVTVGGTSAPLSTMGVVGAHATLSTLAAVAVGSVLGMRVEESIAALGTYEPPLGRMHLLRGSKDTVIIDDTYNASPAAVEAALRTFAILKKEKNFPEEAGLPGGKQVAVLGDMLELGRHSVDEHRKVGALVAQTADLLVTVGFRARDIAQGALDNGMLDANILQYEDATMVGEELLLRLQPGDVVLVKGSQSMRLERVVEQLMAEPERAHELLVRQDAEWKRR